jgi:hypothetical protein
LKIIYAVGGGLAALAVAIFIVTSIGIHTTINPAPSNTTAMPLTIAIKNIEPRQLSNKSLEMQISFNATNPNKSTAILEAIEYNLMVDGHRISSGTIGTRLEGFLASSAGIYPIVGDGNVILKDSQLFQKTNSTSNTWNKIVEGQAKYTVDGTMSFRQISSLQSSSTDKDFHLRYP